MSPSTIERIIYLRYRQDYTEPVIARILELSIAEVFDVLKIEAIACEVMREKSRLWIIEDPELSDGETIRSPFKYGQRVEYLETEKYRLNKFKQGTFIRYGNGDCIIHWDGNQFASYVDPSRIQLVSPIGKAV